MKKMDKLKTFISGSMAVTLVGMIFIVAGCGGSPNGNSDKRIITVTIEPQRYFTEAIAGDKFTVVSMVPKGSSPETYDPTPQQLVSLNESEAYLRIGYIGFEQSWMDKLAGNAPHLQIFDTSKGVELIHQAGHKHGDHYHAGGVEPHIWNSAINALTIAQNTFHALRNLDKDNETFYMARYDSLCKRIERTDSIICRMLTDHGDKAFMIYHPALSYFARDYGLLQVSIEEEGKEPSPGHLKHLIDLCRELDVRVIFVQPEFDQRNAEIVARQTNTRIVPINPLSYEWETEMINVARALTENTHD